LCIKTLPVVADSELKPEILIVRFEEDYRLSHSQILRTIEPRIKKKLFPQFISGWYFVPLRILLQYEGYYGNYNEDYDKPFGNFHCETSYTLHTHDKKHQGKDKENYRKID